MRRIDQWTASRCSSRTTAPSNGSSTNTNRATTSPEGTVVRLVRAGCSGLLLCALLMPAFSATEARADSLRISVFGDSVLLGAADDIVSVLAGNDVSVDAHENVSLLGALSVL